MFYYLVYLDLAWWFCGWRLFSFSINLFIALLSISGIYFIGALLPVLLHTSILVWEPSSSIFSVLFIYLFVISSFCVILAGSTGKWGRSSRKTWSRVWQMMEKRVVVIYWIWMMEETLPIPKLLAPQHQNIRSDTRKKNLPQTTTEGERRQQHNTLQSHYKA